jgi:hypothetical protein
MKTLLTSTFLFIGIAAFSQSSFSYPAIAVAGNSIADFIPEKWTLLDSTAGDLNKDRYSDLAFVLQYEDSIPWPEDETNFEDTVLTQPRILVIAFQDTNTHAWELKLQHNSFIGLYDNPFLDDPFQGIGIQRGVLRLDFHIFRTAGGWMMTSITYLFRYEKNAFRLIGADEQQINRATLEYEARSFNLLTRKWSSKTGNYDKGKETKAIWSTLPNQPPILLENLKETRNLEISPGIYVLQY